MDLMSVKNGHNKVWTQVLNFTVNEYLVSSYKETGQGVYWAAFKRACTGVSSYNAMYNRIIYISR